MGRADAVAFTNQWAARARELGAVVDFEPGWDTRGNGSAANYEGAVVHHTASSSSEARPYPTRSVLLTGRPGLPGPLCNVAGPWCPPDAPRLVVVSARPANHAGASGGPSMGPLPVTTSFNARVFGLEIDYSGLVPMAPGQYRAALIFARAVADVLGRSIEYVRAHAETSVTGKWDPGYANGKTIDMAAFRRDAAAYIPGDDMPFGPHEVNMTWTQQQGTGSFGYIAPIALLEQTGKTVNALSQQVAGLQAALNTLAGAVAANRDDLTADELRAVIREEMANVVDVQVTVRDGSDKPAA